MSVETTVSDQNNNTSGDVTQELEKMRVHQERLLGEAKAAKARVKELETKEQERESALLAEQGKFKDLFDSQAGKLKEANEKLTATEKAFAKKIFTKEVQEIAISMGARKDALEDIVKIGDWNEVEIDEQFNVNQEQLKAQITKLTKSKPFYFSSSATPVRDVNTSAGAKSGGKSLEEMSSKEIEAQLKALGK